MHEAAITHSVMTSVLQTLEEQNVTGTVTHVYVTVGVTQGIVPDSMQMYFDMEKKGTVLENAELVIEIQGIVGRCGECNTEHELDMQIMYCPECASPMELIKGNEIIISSIEVEHE